MLFYERLRELYYPVKTDKTIKHQHQNTTNTIAFL
jgi:hypothetical protein